MANSSTKDGSARSQGFFSSQMNWSFLVENKARTTLPCTEKNARRLWNCLLIASFDRTMGEHQAHAIEINGVKLTFAGGVSSFFQERDIFR